MFNSFDEFSNWLEISRNFDPKVIKDVYRFIETFPLADFATYIKASKKLAKGVSLEDTIHSYEKYSASHEESHMVEIFTIDDCEEEMVKNLNEGLLKGSTTYIPLIDDAWKWRETEFTLFTGNNQDGKSLFMRYLALIKGLEEDWKTAIYAPEDWPATKFFDELVFTASGISTDKENIYHLKEEQYRKVCRQIKPYFTFVNIRPPHNTLENILNAFIPIIEDKGIKIVIIDPLIKITRPAAYVDRDAAWAQYVQAICVDFARRYNICLILVLHQLTPALGADGRYLKPDKYKIKGGGNFSDGADNVMYMQRPNMPVDNMDTLVRFGTLKVKNQRLVAIPQEVFFRFNRKTNRYIDEDTGLDLYDFNSKLNIGRIQLLNFN
jgi:twinkle protein